MSGSQPERDAARTLWIALAAVALAGALASAAGVRGVPLVAATLGSAAIAGVVASRHLRRAMDSQAGPLHDLVAHANLVSAALEGERENLRALVEAHDEPMLAIDSSGRAALANRAAERFLGREPGELAGAGVAGLLAEAGLTEVYESARQGESATTTVRAPSRVGTRVLQASASPLTLAGGEAGALLMWRDVTDLARALQMRTDFVANASHELRTPLAAIRGAIETLMDGAREDPTLGPRLLAMAEGHVLRLEDIINDLLDLSRLESPDATLRVEPMRLEELRSSLAHAFEAVCSRRGVSIDFRLDPAIDGVITDPRLVHLVLRNLIDNATKFCHVGTTVVVTGRLVGARLRFDVQDEGIGIPLAEQQRVWERFHQVDPARSGRPLGGAKRGTGLGLSLVRNAVRALSGEVGLESEYGKGTRVWFEVPVPPPGWSPQAEAHDAALDPHATERSD